MKKVMLGAIIGMLLGAGIFFSIEQIISLNARVRIIENFLNRSMQAQQKIQSVKPAE